jgi:hypothetical protein
MSKRDLVIVEWVDSHGANGWQWLDEVAAGHQVLMHCRTVGWVAARTKDVIVLVSSLSGEKNGSLRVGARGDLSIPLRSVVKITKVKP